VARTPSPLLPGTLELIVLQLLSAEPTNGYDLALRIQTTSKDVLNVNAGSLYPRCIVSRNVGSFLPRGRAPMPAGPPRSIR